MRKSVMYIVFVVINYLYPQDDSTNTQKIKTFQHSFSFGVINSNINWFSWAPKYYMDAKRPFKSDVITDYQLSYWFNAKGFEIIMLYKYIPHSYPFGTKNIIFMLTGYGRRYHHNFLWGINAGWAIFYKVSTPITDSPFPDSTICYNHPCYPIYEYNRASSIIQLYAAYKFFKNKNIVTGLNLQRWVEWYNIGKTSDNANDWLVIELYLKVLLYKKNTHKIRSSGNGN